MLSDSEHDSSIGIQVRQLSHLIRRCADASPAHRTVENMTGVHGWVMGYIASHGDGAVYQRDLEKQFSIRRSTATAILQLMEKNDLIRRESVESDKRLKRIILTEKALSIHRQIEDDHRQLEALMKKGLSEQELKTFFAVTEKIKNNLASEAQPVKEPFCPGDKKRKDTVCTEN